MPRVNNNSKITSDIRLIKPSETVIDLRVQRPEDPQRMANLAEDFNILAMGVPTVSRRSNGTYVLLDGQTRFGALKLLGSADDQFPCTVYEGLSLEQEAEMFRKLNNTKKPGVLELFIVRVTQRDPVALAVNDLIKGCGYVAERGHPNSLNAVGTVEKLFLRDELSTRKAIDTASAAWGVRRESVVTQHLQAFANLFYRYGDQPNPSELAERLRKGRNLDANSLLGRGRTGAGTRGIPVPDGITDILVNVYNFQRKTNKLPAWEV
jgi:hypothetical protein